MSYTVKIAENETHILKIIQDDEAMNPREDFDNFGAMVCWHNRYNLGDQNYTYSEPRDFLESLSYNFVDTDEVNVEELSNEELYGIIKSNCVILPLYLYDHSGITMSTSPFSCSWDSGQVGWIYVTNEEVIKEFGDLNIEKAENLLVAEIEIYDQYLTGDVYGFQIFNKDVDGEEYDCIDSCWGFFGLDNIESEIKHTLGDEYKSLVDELSWV